MQAPDSAQPAGSAAQGPVRAFRRLVEGSGLTVLPGAADAITARVIERAGFAGVYVTGAGFANASFGVPDVGLIALPEIREHVRRIADAVQIPLIVDADTGYGGIMNVRRAVRELESAGASAIQLEDQAEPKRCGHFDGNTIVSIDEMVQRLSAAIDARTDPDLVIIARTDAYQSEGMAGAVKRARIYREAGADLLFVEAPTTWDDLAKLPQLIDAPLLANMVEGGKTPLMSAGQLADAGFRIALYANTALRVAMFAVQLAMDVLRTTGRTDALMDRMLSWEERQRLIGLYEMQEYEARLLSIEAARSMTLHHRRNPGERITT